MDVLVGFVSSQEVTNLALTLIHFVWQGAVIAVGLWIALLITARNNFKLRYRSAVFALILSIASPIATFSYLSFTPSLSQNNLAQLSQIKKEVASSLSESSSKLMNNATQEPATSLSNTDVSQFHYLGYILLAWLLGCVFMTFKFVLDLNRTFRLTREGVTKVSYRVENIVNSLSAKYKLKRRITILKSRKVNVPVVIGWFKPVILLPIAITIGLETKHLELIIAHELAHIKRMDFAVNLFQSIVQICLFYHPVIYWINKVIRDEREYICDQLALEVLGNDESAKINLAKALLGTEELREGNLSLVAVAASGGMLKHRISHILDSQYKPATSIKSLFIGTIVCLFSFAALSTTFELKDNKLVRAVNLELTDKIASEIPNKIQLKDDLANRLSANNRAREVRFANPQNSSLEIKTAEHEGREVNKASVKRSIADSTINKTKSSAITSTIEPDNQTVSVVSKKRLMPTKEIVANNIVKIEEERGEKLSNSISLGEKIVISNKFVNKNLSKVNNELYRELASKALTDQYSLPAAALSNESRLLKTAALDLQSISSFKEPKAIFTPYPKYPRRAWDKMINQTVRVNFSISSEGDVSHIEIVEDADEAFSDEIYRRLRNWKYQPAEKDGVRVAHLTSLEFVFKAPQKKTIPTITTGSRIRRR